MSDPAAPVELLLHIPKCGGSSLVSHLYHNLPRGAYWAPGKRSRSLPLEFFGRKYDPRPPGPLTGIRAVTGHYLGRSIEARFGARQLFRSVLLREPQGLVLSWYNYRQMRYRSLGQAGYPFALHLASQPPDPLAHFVLANWLEIPWLRLAAMSPVEKLARLETAFEGFDFVGDVSDTDRLLAAVSGRLGLPATAARVNTEAAWANETGWRPLRRDALSPEDRDLLDRRTRLDTAFWRRVALGAHSPLSAGEVAPFLASELRRPLAELRRKALRGRATRRRSNLDTPKEAPEGAAQPSPRNGTDP
ncbi:MAG: hypothetical protein ACFBRM_10650 [Pikeienuella sp.]